MRKVGITPISLPYSKYNYAWKRKTWWPPQIIRPLNKKPIYEFTSIWIWYHRQTRKQLDQLNQTMIRLSSDSTNNLLLCKLVCHLFSIRYTNIGDDSVCVGVSQCSHTLPPWPIKDQCFPSCKSSQLNCCVYLLTDFYDDWSSMGQYREDSHKLNWGSRLEDFVKNVVHKFKLIFVSLSKSLIGDRF